jgi:ABC-type dipeptide/oligopeptide/nickel transport system ATPase subunit
MAIHDLRLGYELATRLMVLDRGVFAMDVEKGNISYEELQQQYREILQAQSC